MYALVKLRQEQLLTRKISLPIILINKEVGVIKVENDVINKLENYPEIDYIEPEFLINLRGECYQECEIIPKGMMLLYIGNGFEDSKQWNIYNIDRKDFSRKNNEILRYKAHSHSKKITSLQYLECIIDMIQEATKKGKRLIIYTDLEIKNSQYKYRSLCNKVCNQLLEQVGSILIHKCDKEIKNYYITTPSRFEPYIEQSVYTKDSLDIALRKIEKITEKNKENQVLRKMYRVINEVEKKSLYQDIFYQEISSEEEIYVTLLPTSSLSKEVYKEMGVEYIELLGGHGILRGKKSIFDNYADVLNNDVAPQYTPQILTYPHIRVRPIQQQEQVIPRQEQTYNGEGVYIGVIGTEGINYAQDTYFQENGDTKVAYIWEQIEGDRGNEYTQSDIMEKVKANEKFPAYIEEKLTAEHVVFKIAGGKIRMINEDYRGIATKAQFIVAKINRAPTSFQEIYGGTPNREAVLLEDVIIGIDKLVSFAVKKKTPLVLAIPYGAGVSSHDGALVLEEKIAEYAQQTGVTIITSTGEEADKAHHEKIGLNQTETDNLDLIIKKPNQNVLGGIWIEPFGENSISLYNIETNKEYSLNKEMQYNEEQMKLITTGNRISDYNGLREIIFRLRNSEVGTWQIRVENKSGKGYSSVLDIWLAQQELNPSVTLMPNSVFTTIVSLGNINGTICVGNYDNSTLTTYKTSGRGYSRQNRVIPTLVAQGKEVFELDQHGEIELAEGSLVAMSNIVGVAAAVYSKALVENVNRLPSALGMESLLVSKVKRVDTVEYPNPSQGNGVFDRNSLQEILDINKPLSL